LVKSPENKVFFRAFHVVEINRTMKRSQLAYNPIGINPPQKRRPNLDENKKSG